jgi:hypothetical protein
MIHLSLWALSRALVIGPIGEVGGGVVVGELGEVIPAWRISYHTP